MDFCLKEDASSCFFLNNNGDNNNNNDEWADCFIGLMDGGVNRIRVCVEEDDEGQVLFSSESKIVNTLSDVHSGSVRCFAANGEGARYLFSGSSDRSIHCLDLETLTPLYRINGAHSDAVNVLHSLDANLLVSGDDSGVVKLWDLREAPRSLKRVRRYQEHEDYVSGLCSIPEKKIILSCGGDGYLSVYDYRKTDVLARSDNLEDELTGICLMKNQKKIICPSATGIVHIFSWCIWGDETDRFPKHPASIQSLAKFDENRVLTGGFDGIVRLVEILPNRVIDEIEAHDSSVDDLTACPSLSICASINHERSVRLSAISLPTEEDDEEEEDEKDSDCDSDDSAPTLKTGKRSSKSALSRQLGSAKKKAMNSFFNDLMMEEEVEESEDIDFM